jgi:hypothetical protein
MKPIETSGIVIKHLTASAIVASAFAFACSAGEETSAPNGQDPAEWTGEDFLGEGTEPATAESSAAAHEPATPTEDGALEGRSNSVLWFRWTKGEAAKVLAPHSTHVCALSMVRGQLKTNTSLMVVRSGANWVLRGLNAGDNLLQADAVCEPLSAFRVNAGSTVSVSDNFLASTLDKNVTRSTALPVNAAPVFTGLVGHFEGGGERARITFAPLVEIKNGGQDGTHTASASALSFGLTGNQRPRVNSFYMDGLVVSDGTSRSWHPNDDIVGCDRDWTTCCSSGYICGVKAAPLADSFCYLSSVSGDFNGADEWVQVLPDRANGVWTLAMEAGSGNGVSARVSCLAMDQRTGGGVIR